MLSLFDNPIASAQTVTDISFSRDQCIVDGNKNLKIVYEGIMQGKKFGKISLGYILENMGIYKQFRPSSKKKLHEALIFSPNAVHVLVGSYAYLQLNSQLFTVSQNKITIEYLKPYYFRGSSKPGSIIPRSQSVCPLKFM